MWCTKGGNIKVNKFQVAPRLSGWLILIYLIGSVLEVREGNGTPLQYSCLENPTDGGTWWAAIYGVAQSQTWLKWLSSSSSRNEVEIMVLKWQWAIKWIKWMASPPPDLVRWVVWRRKDATQTGYMQSSILRGKQILFRWGRREYSEEKLRIKDVLSMTGEEPKRIFYST